MEGPEELLLNEFEGNIGKVESAREEMEAELEVAKETGDFSKFYELQKIAKKEIAMAEKAKRKLEGENPLSEISAEYVAKDSKGNEKSETITLNFETELTNWSDFYTKHGIDLPADFAEVMQDIWERNTDVMTEAIKEKGFDRAILIPRTIDDVDLKKIEKEMTEGYKAEAKKAGLPENDTYLGFDLKEVVNSRTGDRIILIHSAPDLTAQPELLKTLDKKYGGEKTSGTDNKAKDFIEAGEQLTITEWFLLQRDIWEKTGIHLEGKKGDDGYIKLTWCPGSRLGKDAGSDVVHACFSPVSGRVRVDADSPVHSNPNIGWRLSRCFK